MAELILNFDDRNEDVELAKEYLKNNASAIPTGYVDYDDPPHKDFEKYTLQFKNLAQKLEENAELFSQLEYHLRKIPKREVVQTDISLLVQNFLFWSSNTKFYNSSNTPVTVGASSPLATLGLVAPLLQYKRYVVITCVPTTAAVCYLFCQLCDEVGLKSDLIKLNICENLDISGDVVKWQDGSAVYGAGIITQRSDLDSAVHAFLGSTTKYPWSIRRVWVQESIYQQFNDAMAWKCNIRRSNATIEPRVKSLCSEVFGYDQKMFLIDYAGNHDDLSEELYLPVMVEAFRTTKELLSMVKQHRPWAVSVWSSDIAEANEVAFGVNSPLVWINDCDTFAGPPRASQVFYSRVVSRRTNWPEVNDFVNETLQLRHAWSKKSIADRVEALRTALVKYEPKSKFAELQTSFNKLQLHLSLEDTDKFVEVENGRICVGIEEPAGVVCLDKDIDCNVDMLIEVFVSMIRGNAVLYSAGISNELFHLLHDLEENKLPLFYNIPDILPRSYFYRTKVVWTNYGTTFAN